MEFTNKESRYQAIQNEDLRNRLLRIDKVFDDRAGSGTIRVPDLWKWPFCESLLLKYRDAQWMTSRVIERKIIDYLLVESKPGKSPSHDFDKDRCLAFTGLVWAATKSISPNLRGIYTLDRNKIVWESVVAEAKEAFGEHPLGTFIHNPQEFTPVVVEEEKPKVKPKLKEKPKGVFNKFPDLDGYGLHSLSIYNLDALADMIAKIPEGQIEAVSPIKHNIPYHLLKSVMFMAFADRKRLSEYDPSEDVYSLLEFRNGLIISKNHLLADKIMAERVERENELITEESKKKRFTRTNNLAELVEKMQKYLLTQERKQS